MKTNLINNEWLEASGDVFSSLESYSQEVLWQGKEATERDVDSAVKAGRASVSSWSNSALKTRLEIIEKFRIILDEKKEEVAELISKEMGKPLWEARTEVLAMLAKVPNSIKAYNERCKSLEKDLSGAKSITRFKPHGVVAVFGPFNFPGHLPNGHIIPALIAGNTVVFKPSEQTPRVGEKLVQLWLEAGLPKGVINLVQGAKVAGIALANHQDLDGLFFTGSSQVGKIIHKSFGGRPDKILALEMGGNNPLVIWDGEDKKLQTYLTIQSAFITSGQRCTCARRLIVPEDANFIDELVQTTKKLVVGAYNQKEEPFMGPVINPQAGKSIQEAEKKILSLGAKSLLPTKVLEGKDNLLTPSIVDVTGIDGLEDEEVFGPMLKIYRVKNFKEAISLANNTRFGLSASLVCPSREKYEEFYQAIRAGIVNWNRQTTGASGAAPFGGVGDSGNHRPSAYFAADYSAYPVATIEAEESALPEKLPPGFKF